MTLAEHFAFAPQRQLAGTDLILEYRGDAGEYTVSEYYLIAQVGPKTSQVFCLLEHNSEGEPVHRYNRWHEPQPVAETHRFTRRELLALLDASEEELADWTIRRFQDVFFTGPAK